MVVANKGKQAMERGDLEGGLMLNLSFVYTKISMKRVGGGSREPP